MRLTTADKNYFDFCPVNKVLAVCANGIWNSYNILNIANVVRAMQRYRFVDADNRLGTELCVYGASYDTAEHFIKEMER